MVEEGQTLLLWTGEHAKEEEEDSVEEWVLYPEEEEEGHYEEWYPMEYCSLEEVVAFSNSKYFHH